MIDIYLASPYSHDEESVMEERFELACMAAAALQDMGYTVFSPIAHSHPIAKYTGNPTDGEYWLKQDRPHYEACRWLGILTIDGWKESKGMAKEFLWAIYDGKPICYIRMMKCGDGAVVAFENVPTSYIPEKNL